MNTNNIHHIDFDFDKHSLREECFAIDAWAKYGDPRSEVGYSDTAAGDLQTKIKKDPILSLPGVSDPAQTSEVAAHNLADFHRGVQSRIEQLKNRGGVVGDKENPFEVKHIKTREGQIDNSFPAGYHECQRFLNRVNLIGCEYSCVYHRLIPNRNLMPHTDFEVKCAVNLLLDDKDESASITFLTDNGIEKHKYELAVLNVQELHSVKNGPNYRHLFKIAFYQNDLEDIINRL